MTLEESLDASTPLLSGDEITPTRNDMVSENDDFGPPRRGRRHWLSRQVISLAPGTEEQDSVPSILVGLLIMILAGAILGGIMPKNEALPTQWYRTVSSMIGYTCFVLWSISFYPQVWNNGRRRTTHGLSADFAGLNVLGFGCYAVYNVAMFSSTEIHQQYRDRHPNGASSSTVQSNDVAFALHALVLASITFGQIAYYDGFRSQRPSKLIAIVIVGILVLVVSYPLLVALGLFGCNWLDYLYLLSFNKIAVTLVKYIPQVVLNYRRKSTVGFSIWQILLDFGGGVLSELQLLLDSADLQDWSGITGNPAKFCLGFVSIFFDCIFMAQHYVLYRTATTTTTTTASQPMDSNSLHRDADLNESNGTAVEDTTA
jgi:cystinosin